MNFSATVITGSGRGKLLGYPTINLEPSEVPAELEHGMYATRVMIDNKSELGVLHYGVRPTFGDVLSCEVHIVDKTHLAAPPTLAVEIIKKLRDVQEFETAKQLIEQIQKDIGKSKRIFSS